MECGEDGLLGGATRMSEADIRAAFAPLIGATVPDAQQATGETRAVEKVWTPDELAQLQALGIDPEAAKPRAEKVRSYGTYQVPNDTILLAVEMRDRNGRLGGRNVYSIKVADFAKMFGAVFASGKRPTVAAFMECCNAPVTVTLPPDPATPDAPAKTEQRPNCLGFCRIAREQDWVGKGILAP